MKPPRPSTRTAPPAWAHHTPDLRPLPERRPRTSFTLKIILLLVSMSAVPGVRSPRREMARKCPASGARTCRWWSGGGLRVEKLRSGPGRTLPGSVEGSMVGWGGGGVVVVGWRGKGAPPRRWGESGWGGKVGGRL